MMMMTLTNGISGIRRGHTKHTHTLTLCHECVFCCEPVPAPDTSFVIWCPYRHQAYTRSRSHTDHPVRFACFRNKIPKQVYFRIVSGSILFAVWFLFFFLLLCDCVDVNFRVYCACRLMTLADGRPFCVFLFSQCRLSYIYIWIRMAVCTIASPRSFSLPLFTVCGNCAIALPDCDDDCHTIWPLRGKFLYIFFVVTHSQYWSIFYGRNVARVGDCAAYSCACAMCGDRAMCIDNTESRARRSYIWHIRYKTIEILANCFVHQHRWIQLNLSGSMDTITFRAGNF